MTYSTNSDLIHPIFRFKTDAMRQLLNLTSRGYTLWTSGQVSPKKCPALVYKFRDRYDIDATHQQRYRAKKKGLCITTLILWQDDPDTVHWWLLTTAGEGVIKDLEKLNDAKINKHRLTCTGYELVKTPRKDNPARWSWRMTKDTEAEWHRRFQRSIRSQDKMILKQSVYSLKRVPAFAESRRQVFAIMRKAKNEWIRTRKGPWPYEDFKQGWIGRYKPFRTTEVKRNSIKSGRKSKKLELSDT